MKIEQELMRLFPQEDWGLLVAPPHLSRPAGLHRPAARDAAIACWPSSVLRLWSDLLQGLMRMPVRFALVSCLLVLRPISAQLGLLAQTRTSDQGRPGGGSTRCSGPISSSWRTMRWRAGGRAPGEASWRPSTSPPSSSGWVSSRRETAARTITRFPSSPSPPARP